MFLGNTKIVRDRGWALEYVEAMWIILREEQPEDYVVATGRSIGLEAFGENAFRHIGLDWREHVVSAVELFRPSDIPVSQANPAKAATTPG